jgi:hypothetical protein
MYTKIGALAHLESKQSISRREKSSLGVCVGDQKKCPECSNTGRVVWISEDKKTMGVRCHASHLDASRADSKFGPRTVASGKAKKNVVFLVPVV